MVFCYGILRESLRNIIACIVFIKDWSMRDHKDACPQLLEPLYYCENRASDEMVKSLSLST